jgi:hypothetical protein
MHHLNPVGPIFVHLAAALATAAAAPPAAAAATPPRPYDFAQCDVPHALRIPKRQTTAALTTDLEAPPWNRAARITGFLAIGGERPAKNPTHVYAAYDTDALYVAFRCAGRAASDLKRDIADRDGPVWRDDSIELYLNPEHAHHSYYQIVVNADGRVYDARGTDKAWNAAVGVKTAADPNGWTAALQIPFRAFPGKAPQPGDVWTVNFCRTDRPDASPDRSCWTPVVTKSFSLPARFGHLIFGGPDEPPVRLLDAPAPAVGPNTLAVDPTTPSTLTLTGLDAAGAARSQQSIRVPSNGRLRYDLDDDRDRRIVYTLRDDAGRTLAQWADPLQSPAVTERLTALQRQLRTCQDTLDRFPAAARPLADRAVQSAAPRLRAALATAHDPHQRSPRTWTHLDAAARELEQALAPTAAYAETLAHFPNAPYALGLESPMRKVMIRDFPFEGFHAPRARIKIARNEHEAIQLVVMPYHQPLRNLDVAVSQPRNAAGNAPRSAVTATVALVGHVDVADNPPYPVDDHGWWPDPLLPFQTRCDAAIGEHIAFWIDVATTADPPPGDYTAAVTIRAGDVPPIELPLDIHVWDFALPDGTHLRNAFSFHVPHAKRIYGDRWNRRLEAAYYDFLLDHRLNIDHLYRSDPPDLDVLKHGVARGMNAFNVINLGKGKTKKMNEICDKLDRVVPALKRAGLFKYAYVYGFDEVTEDRFPDVRRAFGRIHDRYPGLPTMTTAFDFSFGRRTGLRDAVDIWVPLTEWYDPREAAALRAEGRDMWWYICVSPHHPYANFFVEYPAIEPRLLTGAMSYKYHTGGFLYYMTDKWDHNKDPITAGPYTKWDPNSYTNSRNETANGDGSLLCPGPDGPLSTIRLENIRDGFEDYEYLCLLRDCVQRVTTRQPDDEHRAFLATASQLLAVPDSVVRSLVSYTRDPAVLSAYRDDLADAIIAGRRLAPSDRSHHP